MTNEQISILAINNLKSDDGLICRNYLESRNIENLIVNKFSLGWIGSSRITGIDNSMCGRLIVPLHNMYGDVIAFAGRIPTYSNGNRIHSLYNNEIVSVKGEYVVKPTWKHQSFFKRNYLYGLKQSYRDIIHNNYAVVVEGEFDLWACHQSGLCNCVSLLGSTMSILQLSKLKRFCDNIFLMLDGDKAGQTGSNKIIKEFGSYSNIQNICLPDDLDPFDFITKFGIDPIYNCIKQKINEYNNMDPF